MIERELRVAFSRTHQSLPVRIVKWLVFFALVYWLHDRRYFWHVVVIAFAAAICLHFFYRWKTNAWTRAWGGWDDVEAIRAFDLRGK